MFKQLVSRYMPCYNKPNYAFETKNEWTHVHVRRIRTQNHFDELEFTLIIHSNTI